jgi:hypothetical protein
MFGGLAKLVKQHKLENRLHKQLNLKSFETEESFIDCTVLIERFWDW